MGEEWYTESNGIQHSPTLRNAPPGIPEKVVTDSPVGEQPGSNKKPTTGTVTELPPPPMETETSREVQRPDTLDESAPAEGASVQE